MERGGFHGYRGNANSNSASPSSGLKLTSNGSSSSSNSAARAEENNECTVREQDRFMPIANVIRIMRKILPPHAKISDDAKETIQECVSEYISFVTGEANERCQREQRKTITAEDILWAMSKLGFDDYIEPLTIFLHRYREVEGDRGSVRGDPLVRRPVVDYGGYSFGAPPMGQHSNGFAPAPAMGGYMNDAAAGRGSASQAPSAPNGQPNGHYK